MTERRIVTDAEAEHERLIARGAMENPITSGREVADSYVILALLDTREELKEALERIRRVLLEGEDRSPIGNVIDVADAWGQADDLLARLRGDA